VFDPFYIGISCIALSEVSAFALIAVRYTAKKRRVLELLLIAVFGTGLVVSGFVFFPFAWNLIRSAIDITVHSTFSTTYPAIVRDVAVGIYVALRLLSRGGGIAVLRHLDNIKDALTAVIMAFALTFLFHLFVTVPRAIYAVTQQTMDRYWVTTQLPPAGIFSPPQVAYQKQLTPKKSNRRYELLPPTPPMFSEAPDEFHISGGSISGTIKNGGSMCLVDAAGRCLVRGYVENGHFFANADIVVYGPNVDVQLTKNVLHKSNAAWDRCFNSTALEVVDQNLIPMFQNVIHYPTRHLDIRTLPR